MVAYRVNFDNRASVEARVPWVAVHVCGS